MVVSNPSRRSQAAARHLAALLTKTLPADELERFVRHLEEDLGAAPTLPPIARAVVLEHLTGGRTYGASERAELEARALLARSADRRALLAGALKTSQVARVLGRSRQAVHDRVKSGALLAINDSGDLRYPAWQFDATAERGVVSGLPAVLAVLAVDPLSQARWLTRPNATFEGHSPLEVLKDAGLDRVLAEARGVAPDA